MDFGPRHAWPPSGRWPVGWVGSSIVSHCARPTVNSFPSSASRGRSCLLSPMLVPPF